MFQKKELCVAQQQSFTRHYSLMRMHDVAFTDKIANGITPIKLAHLNRDSRENTKEIENYTKAMARGKKSPMRAAKCAASRGAWQYYFLYPNLRMNRRCFPSS